MTQEERREIIAELDRLEERRLENLITEQPGADPFTESVDRWHHARVAFPGMTYDEFVRLAIRRGRGPGRPSADSQERADDPIFRAARDFDHIRFAWPHIPRADALELSAQRHKVVDNVLDDIVRRPASRRHDRRARK